jgi:hypothetical protein
MALLAACSSEPDPQGECPCASGFTCCEATGRCVPSPTLCGLASGDGGGPEAGSPERPDALAHDVAPTADAPPPDASTSDAPALDAPAADAPGDVAAARDLPAVVDPPDATVAPDVPSQDVGPISRAPAQGWMQIMKGTAPWPPAMSYAGFTFDSSRGKAVLFGGYRYDPVKGPQVFGELWEWDGAAGSWRNRTPAALPPEWPAARFNPSMVYDSRRARVVVLGGWTYLDGVETRVPDIWEWDGAAGTWRSRDPAGLPPQWPGATFGAAAYDSTRAAVFLHHGSQQTTWEWNPLSGEVRDRTPPTPGRDAPPPVSGRAIYDPFRQRTVLFASSTGATATTVPPLVWEWNPDTGRWQDLHSTLTTTVEPPGRRGFDIVFDELHHAVVLFGGLKDPQYRRDLWDWHAGSEWIDRTPATFSQPWPSGRVGHSTTYDGARGRVILFGGGGQAGPLDELWELDVTR